MNAEIELYQKITNPMEAAQQLGEWFARSGMFGCERVEQGQIMALTCLAEKCTPIDINRKYHLIDGKLSMRTDYMLADYRARGGKCVWIETGDDGKLAKAKFAFDGNDVVVSFSIEEATRAGLIKPKSGWTTFPGAMLRARLVAKAMRMIAPEVIAGCVAVEEAEDSRTVPPKSTASPIQTNQTPAMNQATAKVIDVPPVPAQSPCTEQPPVATDASDCSVMPIGPHAGKKWTEFTTKQLISVQKKSVELPVITAGHLEAIASVIASRNDYTANQAGDK